jgi:hypothetical protein
MVTDQLERALEGVIGLDTIEVTASGDDLTPSSPWVSGLLRHRPVLPIAKFLHKK